MDPYVAFSFLYFATVDGWLQERGDLSRTAGEGTFGLNLESRTQTKVPFRRITSPLVGTSDTEDRITNGSFSECTSKVGSDER